MFMESVSAHSTLHGQAGRLITVAQTKRLGSMVAKGPPSRVSVLAVIGTHDDVGAALQFGVDPARLFESCRCRPR